MVPTLSDGVLCGVVEGLLYDVLFLPDADDLGFDELLPIVPLPVLLLVPVPLRTVVLSFTTLVGPSVSWRGP